MGNRRLVFLGLPLFLGIVLASATLAAAPLVPDPMATQFDANGLPGESTSRAVGLAISPLVALAGAVMLVAVSGAGRRVSDGSWLAAFCYLVIGSGLAVQLVLVASNAGASDSSVARLQGTGWLALPLFLAAFGFWAGRRCKQREPLAASTRAANVKIETDRDQVVIRMRGLDVLWALRRSVVVPRRAVLRAQVADLSAVRRTGLRLPGTEVPGVLRAGSYGTGAAREFWNVRQGPRALVLTLADGQPYRRLVVQPPDPDAVLTELQRLGV